MIASDATLRACAERRGRRPSMYSLAMLRTVAGARLILVMMFGAAIACACGGDKRETSVEVTHAAAGPHGTAAIVTRVLRIPDDDEAVRRNRHARLHFYGTGGESWSADVPGRVTGRGARAGIGVGDDVIVVRYADSSNQVWLRALALDGAARWTVKMGKVANEDEITGLGVMRPFLFSKDSVLVPIQEFTAVEVRLRDGEIGQSRASDTTVRDGQFQNKTYGRYVMPARDGTQIASVAPIPEAAPGAMFVAENGTYRDHTVLIGSVDGVAHVLAVDREGKVLSSQTFPDEMLMEGVETDPYDARSAWGQPLTRFVPLLTTRKQGRDQATPDPDTRRLRIVDLDSSTSTVLSKDPNSVLLRDGRYWVMVEGLRNLVSLDGDTGSITRAATGVISFLSPLAARDGFLWLADGSSRDKPRVEVVDFASLTPKLGSGRIRPLPPVQP